MLKTDQHGEISFKRNVNIKTRPECNIIPNPTKEIAELFIPFDYQTEYHVMISDLHGKELFRKSFSNEDKLELSLNGYQKGIYIVSYWSNREMMGACKIIKQ